jgi:hypothetical protein
MGDTLNIHMRNYSGSQSRPELNNPKNGYQRVTVDREDMRHLEVFNNGSWRHDAACREYTNKDCRKQ